MRKNEMYRRMKQNKKHAPTSYQRNAQIKVPKNVFHCFLNFLVLQIITFLTSSLTISLTRRSFYLLSRSRRIPGCYVTVMCHCIRPDFLDIFSKPRPIPVYLVLRYSLLRLLRDFFFNCQALLEFTSLCDVFGSHRSHVLTFSVKLLTEKVTDF